MKSRTLCYIACLLPLLTIAGNPRETVEGNNKFAFRLFREGSFSAGENVVCSPFSISTALAMTYAGARGETARQMEQAMNFQPGDLFHQNYKDLLHRLDEGTGGRIKLNIANGLWAQRDFQFLPSYFDLVRSNYNSELKNADFRDVIEREQTRSEINAWVEQQTNDKIKGLISKYDLNSLTRLVLVNAIWFYGDWAVPFEKASTGPKDFFLADDTRVAVPFMNRHGRYNYYEDLDIKAIEIPYQDNRASMVIFLPKEKTGITDFEKTFDHRYYLKILDAFQPGEVRLSMPKFKTDYKIYLKKTLSQMGMPAAFSPTNANFQE